VCVCGEINYQRHPINPVNPVNKKGLDIMKLRSLLLILILLTPIPAIAVEATFQPRITLQGEYTDNVDRTRHDAEEEIITTVSPGATLAVIGGIAGVTIDYDPSYAIYNEDTHDDLWRHHATFEGWLDLSRRTRLDLSDIMVISDDPADDETDTTIRRGRNRYNRHDANINLGHQFGREDTIDLGYNYSVLNNQSDLFEDSYRHNPYLDTTWWFIENSYGLDLHGDFTRGHFQQSDDFDSLYGYIRLRKRFTRHFDAFLQYAHTRMEYEGLTEDYEIYDPGIGFNYIAGDYTNISLVLGYTIRDREISDDQESLIVNGDLTTAWVFRRARIDLAATSGYRQNTFGAENNGFNLYTSVDCSAEYSFTRTFNGDIFGRYRYDRYLDFNPEIEDNTISTGVGLSHHTLSWMLLRFEYIYRTVTSNEDIREYDENRAFLSISLTPSRPYRLEEADEQQ
jgi:hypothetical protein